MQEYSIRLPKWLGNFLRRFSRLRTTELYNWSVPVSVEVEATYQPGCNYIEVRVYKCNPERYETLTPLATWKNCKEVPINPAWILDCNTGQSYKTYDEIFRETKCN